MKIWEFRNGALNDFAVLVDVDNDELAGDDLKVNGAPLDWKVRPRATAFVEPRKKKSKPRADISALVPGALVFNARAKASIGEFLANFGELLEMDVDGQVEWFYNVTRTIDCIDLKNSTVRASGTIAKEAFVAGSIPVEPAIFKDPRTARTRIYVNEAAKHLLQETMTSARISGAEFAEPGPPPPRPRPSA